MEAILPGQVRDHPDATLEEHREAFEEETEVRVSSAASVSRALKRLGLPLKKSRP